MTFADNQTALQIVKDLFPEAQNVKLVEHGSDNLVVLVDEKYAVRFPKHEEAYERSKYEKEILEDFSTFNKIHVPHIVGEGENPPYMITDFLRGVHLTSSDIQKFTLEKQKKIGEEFAIFAHAMHSLHSVEKAKEIRKRLKLDVDGFAEYFEKMLLKTKLPNATQDKIAKEYFRKWSVLEYSTPEFVLHDDLHSDNLLFENDELTGVLDFTDTSIGHPEEELRVLHWISETVLDAAVKKYQELSGLNLNLEAIKIWSIMQDMALYNRNFIKNDFEGSGFARAVRNLNKWLPEGNWGVGVISQNIDTTQ